MKLAANDPAVPPPVSTLQIWDVLAGLHLLRAHLWLGVTGKPPAGVTVLISVSAREGWFLLDALRDDDALKAGDAVYFDTQVEGRRLRIECRILRMVALDDGPAYVAAEPRIVVDQQRRASYRVRLPTTTLLRAAITDPRGTVTPARLVDLSQSGCGARMSSELAAAPGDAVHVRVSLDDFDLSTPARVAHLETGGSGTHIGLEFSIDEQAARERLAQSVFRLQRQILRDRQG
ncbi:MAG TPA: PilZ domain-containing protein [Nevskiaceae bacterium]|nr:PilZ domain-containing protein [Nevskiaceae bacterium]